MYMPCVLDSVLCNDPLHAFLIFPQGIPCSKSCAIRCFIMLSCYNANVMLQKRSFLTVVFFKFWKSHKPVDFCNFFISHKRTKNLKKRYFPHGDSRAAGLQSNDADVVMFWLRWMTPHSGDNQKPRHSCPLADVAKQDAVFIPFKDNVQPPALPK